jgi:ribosomal protein L14
MIQLRSVLSVADNSGAKHLKVIHVHGGSFRRFGFIGDMVTAAVDQADPNGYVKDSQLVKAVIVRTRKETRRADGAYVASTTTQPSSLTRKAKIQSALAYLAQSPAKSKKEATPK